MPARHGLWSEEMHRQDSEAIMIELTLTPIKIHKDRRNADGIHGVITVLIRQDTSSRRGEP